MEIEMEMEMEMQMEMEMEKEKERPRRRIRSNFQIPKLCLINVTVLADRLHYKPVELSLGDLEEKQFNIHRNKLSKNR